MNDQLVLQKVRALGIADPLQATAQTVKLVVGAYCARKIFDERSFEGYMGMLNPSLYCLIEGLKAFSMDQTGVSHKAHNAIDAAIGILRTRIERPDVTPAEARDIRLALMDLVRQAREESSEQRILTLGFAAFAATAAMAVLGGIVALSEQRKAGAVPLLRDR